MAIPIVQIDSFTDRPFRGNPAAVCLLVAQRSDEWLQAVAAEMNLSETAFVRRLDDGFELRWFTPKVEVDLCGHATLAAAHALWSEYQFPPSEKIVFHTRSGVLTCQQRGRLIELDFPATPPHPIASFPGLLEALDTQAVFIGRSSFDVLVVMSSDSDLIQLSPDFAVLRRLLGVRGVIITARSSKPDYDFVSRYFAPGVGIDEDPVTGSAHCCLGPYWAERLGKNKLVGYQASHRGGIVEVQLSGERIMLGGQAVTVLRGALAVDS